jgi:hypothetical protein
MRHDLQTNATCVLCSQEESISHLLLGCAYTREVWYKVLRRFGWHSLSLTNEDDELRPVVDGSQEEGRHAVEEGF